nr:hypothetical protein Iba_scaffold16408CG0020 [Ipomoea batatas]
MKFEGCKTTDYSSRIGILLSLYNNICKEFRGVQHFEVWLWNRWLPNGKTATLGTLMIKAEINSLIQALNIDFLSCNFRRYLAKEYQTLQGISCAVSDRQSLILIRECP